MAQAVWMNWWSEGIGRKREYLENPCTRCLSTPKSTWHE